QAREESPARGRASRAGEGAAAHRRLSRLRTADCVQSVGHLPPLPGARPIGSRLRSLTHLCIAALRQIALERAAASPLKFAAISVIRRTAWVGDPDAEHGLTGCLVRGPAGCKRREQGQWPSWRHAIWSSDLAP